MTKADYRILEALDDPEIMTVVTPSVIAYNLDLSRVHVSRRLREHVERGLVEKVDSGKYRITDKGRSVVTES
jgi:predicted transcriptional regulator